MTLSYWKFDMLLDVRLDVCEDSDLDADVCNILGGIQCDLQK